MSVFTVADYLRLPFHIEEFNVKLDEPELQGKRLFGMEFCVRQLNGAERLDFLDIEKNGTESKYRQQVRFVLANCVIDKSRMRAIGRQTADSLIACDFECAMKLFDKILDCSGMIDKAEEEVVTEESKNSEETATESSADNTANATA